MKALAVVLFAALIAGGALWILVQRIRSFIRTNGQSACDSCPYACRCRDRCEKEGGRRA